MERMSETLGAYLPGWAVAPIVALITLIVGWIIAVIVRSLVAGGINKTSLGQKAQSTGGNIGKAIGKALFWIILLVALLLALGQFPSLEEPLQPLNDMTSGILGYGKNIIGAILLLIIGGVVAKVGKEATQSSLEAAQADTLAVKAGLKPETSTTSIPRALGGLVFALILIFFGIAAIDALGIEVISNPITSMLETVLDYIPQIFSAAIILAIAVWIGRFVNNLAQNTLPALGVDSSLSAITSLDGEDEPGFKPSVLIGNVAMIGIILMGLSAAMNILNIEVLTNVFNTILEVGGRAVLAVLIVGIGFFIANLVAKFAQQAGGDLAGTIIKYALIVLFTFMGLETLQLGEGIVDIAFRYSVMAAAVAAGVGGAIAFGLGGREWASKKLEEWFPAGTSTTRKTTARKTPRK